MKETKQQRAVRRGLRRVINRGPLDAATGEGFVKDKSSTKAVLYRMDRMPWWLRGEVAPPLDADGRVL